MFSTTRFYLLLLGPGLAALLPPAQVQTHRFSTHGEELPPALPTTQSYARGQLGDGAHLELLVVVGPDVQQLHRQDTERYVLTNLNIASELLRDVTLGADMRVHLVRLIVLSEAEPEIQLSPNISSSLRSVCDWGRRINPPDDTDPLHADLLLYITRYDLVLHDGNKQVRGVTRLGGACSGEWSCVITEDTGFDLGVTIAHEIGHSLGIDHDGVGNTCPRSGFVMASDGGDNSVDLTWSPCSRRQLLDVLSLRGAACLSDLPAVTGSIQDSKPGLYYGVDDQCRVAFGLRARACPFTTQDLPTCRVLSCQTNPDDHSSCRRLLVPLLDGTECAPHQWCLKGLCVRPDHFSSSVVHGSWSSWSEFSPCSRTCGGGVTHRTRQCNNPRPAFGGTECQGLDLEAVLCQQQSCDSTQLDFIAEQCSQTDPQPLHLQPATASFYTWVPAVGFAQGEQQCRLLCQAQGESFIVSRGSQFVDGTRCDPPAAPPFGSTAACVRGRCQLFGCDGVLHSGKVWDVCGVCDGDGSSCTLTSDTYSAGQAKEYTTFLSLPVNATQVLVVNTSPRFTHLAVVVNQRYLVSGQGRVSLNVSHPSAVDDRSLKYHLHLSHDFLPEREELTLPGPLLEDVDVQVYRKYGPEYGDQTNPNISYQFYLPARERESADSAPSGQWVLQQLPCSVSCGRGIQKYTYVCTDENTGCESPEPDRPPQTSCLFPACPPRWEAGGFGPCSASCGGGRRVRPVICVQNRGPDEVQVPDAHCSADSAPVAAETCNLEVCPARWHVSESGNCSAVCGPGQARRVVRCVQTKAGQDVEVDPGLCPQLRRPPDSVPCVVDVCPIGWESEGADQPAPRSGLSQSTDTPVYVWSPVVGQCSKTCDGGTLQVWFSCVDHQTRLGVPDLFCDASSRPPPQSESCGAASCPATWRSKEGACSVTCGGGVANRVLYCARETETGETVVVDSECGESEKPAAVVTCSTHSCPAGWTVLGTSPCSASCDLGVAQRTVSCVQSVNGRDTAVSEGNCPAGVKPATTVPCLLRICTFGWEAKPWSQCSVDCGYGIQSRAVSCLGPSQPEPVSPLLCMHAPKPITIQGCYRGSCREEGPTPTTPNTPTTPAPTLSSSDSPRFRTDIDPSPTTSTTAATTGTKGPCGRLLQEESGTVVLNDVVGRCMLSIGRPLDEVIHVRVESSSLDCSKKEYVVFFDRLSFVRKCVQVAGTELTTRTNILLVRLDLRVPGNGIVFTYKSEKNTKRSHHRDCDVQLFAPSGRFENPTTSDTNHTCRVLVNAPPSVRIRIQALHVGPPSDATTAPSTYISIRDTDVLRTNVFRGPRLFVWQSSGNMAEVEFHGEYLRSKGSFRAEYSFVNL